MKERKFKTRKFRIKQINVRLTEEVKQDLDLYLVETQQTAADFFERLVIQEILKNKNNGSEK